MSYGQVPSISAVHASKLDARQSAQLGHLQLSFEENRGQFSPMVKYGARWNQGTLLLTQSGADFDLIFPDKGSSKSSTPDKSSSKFYGKVPRLSHRSLLLNWLHSSRDLNVLGDQPLATKTNYFVGSNPELWKRNVPSYAKVIDRNVWPGIDVVFYGNQTQTEFDLNISPGADINAVNFRVDGASGLSIDHQGNLVAAVDDQTVTLLKPEIYQLAPDGSRVSVQAHYVLASGNEVRFAVSNYDHSRQLTIDPVVQFSQIPPIAGYLIESSTAVDANGNIYVTGNVEGQSGYFFGPSATAPGFQKTDPNTTSWVSYLMELSPDFQTVLYATFLGGTSPVGSNTMARSIAVSPSGKAWLGGLTQQSDFPTTSNSIINQFPGIETGFLSEFDGSGNLVYSTYYNPTHSALNITYNTDVNAIAVDTNGAVYATGNTGYSLGLSCNLKPTGCGDNFFAIKIDPSLDDGDGPDTDSLAWEYVFGGTGEDFGSGVTVDGTNASWFTGYTYSADFNKIGAWCPLFSHCPQPFQPHIGGGCTQSNVTCEDAFVIRVSATGYVEWGTYFGSDQREIATGITTDGAGNSWIIGETMSASLPGATMPCSTSSGAQILFASEIAFDASSVMRTICFSRMDSWSEELAVQTPQITFDPVAKAPVIAGQSSNSVYTLPPVNSLGQATINGSNGPPGFLAAMNAANLDSCFPVDGSMPNCPGGLPSIFDYSTLLQVSPVLGLAVDPSGYAVITGNGSQIWPFYITPGQFSSNPSTGFVVMKISRPSAAALKYPTSADCGTSNVGEIGTSPCLDGPLDPNHMLTNGGDQNLVVTSAQLSGANPADFRVNNLQACQSVSSLTECTMDLQFIPTATGKRAATLTITSNSVTSPDVIQLTGTGTQGVLVITPSSLSFGSHPLYSSTQLNLTLQNTGTGSVNITGIQNTGNNPSDFGAASNTCGSLAVGATCTIAVVFSPSAPGARSAIMQLYDDAAGSPQQIALTGVGISPVVSVTPTSLNFGTQAFGTTTPAQTVTVTSTGVSQVSFTGASFAGTDPQDFILSSDTCNSLTKKGATCSLGVEFAPQGYGARKATLNIYDNAAGNPQKVTLTGSGPTFTFSVSPTSVTVVHGSSTTATITLTPVAGFNQLVALGCIGVKSSGISCAVSPSSIQLDGTDPATATVKISTASTTAPGTYNLTTSGRFAGGISFTANVSLTVQ